MCASYVDYIDVLAIRSDTNMQLYLMKVALIHAGDVAVAVVAAGESHAVVQSRNSQHRGIV